jgi:hypothetical protein
MPSTIAALDPVTGNRGLLVEVHPESTQVPADVVRALSERMFLRSIRVGLIVARKETLVLRDTLSSMDFRENRYEKHVLDTGDLFAGAKVGAPAVSESEFVKCVVHMLEAIASSWYSFLHQSAISAMVPDVVGNLAQANLEVWEGVLERHDAAE